MRSKKGAITPPSEPTAFTGEPRTHLDRQATGVDRAIKTTCLTCGTPFDSYAQAEVHVMQTHTGVLILL